MHEPGRAPAELPEALRRYQDALVEGDTRYGRMCWFRHDDPIGMALTEYGQWAQREISLLSGFLRPGDTVLDIGSYVGTHARGFAAALGESGRVVAVEPQPVVVEVLRLNVAECPVPVEVIHAAVGAAEGQINLKPPAVQEHGNFGAASPLISRADIDCSASVTIPVVTVDGLTADSVRLLKVDVEGMEADVLRGASHTIDTDRPIIYAEANSLEGAVPVYDMLRERGYRLWLHRPFAFDPQNVAGKEDNFFGVACESNIMAVPSEQVSELPKDFLEGQPDIVAVGDLDEFAAEFFRVPRYGDQTAYDRDPVELKARLKEEQQRSEVLLQQAQASRRDAKAAVCERDALSVQLRAERQRAAAALQQAEVALGELDGSLRVERDLRDELRGSQARLAAIEASTAWRVAKPIRVLGDVKRTLADRRTGQILRMGKSAVSGRLPDDVRLQRHRRILADSGLFDEAYYRSAYPDVPVNDPLGHYLRHGATEGRHPNPLFDTDWYLDTYHDVAAAGMNPLLHYVLTGAAEGRDPGPNFCTSWYVATNEDIRQAGLNPLTHYLRHGREEGRPARPAFEDEPVRATERPVPVAPAAEEWAAVPPPEISADGPAVIVPVYRGHAETLRCLYSVLTSRCQTGYRLIVVDDASPEPELSTVLCELAERGLFELLTNTENLGFVKSVNRGMRAAAGQDVVLLNSDTEVYGDWLDRLRKVAWEKSRRGSVTPLTNSGTIASYPRFTRDNPGLLECPPEEIDRLAAETLTGDAVEIPTCVGFCVYIRRDCLDEVGLFDEASFGLGYGEENDFSLRASAAGWHHVLTGEVYVWHHGSTSFGSTASSRQRRGLEVLNARYPCYGRIVADHIADDPAASMRKRLDLARLHRMRDNSPSILLVTHALGGGTERHVHDLAAMLEDKGVLPLVLRPSPDGRHVRLESPLSGKTPNLVYGWETATDPNLVADLTALGVMHIHIHHLQGYADGQARIPALTKSLDAQFDMTLHDFTAVCPRVDMVDHTRRFCGGPATAKCQACVDRNGSPYGHPDVAAWHRDYAELLNGARRVVVPSHDTASHIGGIFNDIPLMVLPHPDRATNRAEVRGSSDDGLVHVAVLGAISLGKGSELLHELAIDAQRRQLRLHFHVFGYTTDDSKFLNLDNVTISGRYHPDHLPDLVEASGSRIAFFPAVAPETYSYTLSESLALGLHPVALDIGAVAERIRASGHGTVLPWALVDDVSALNDRLLQVEPHEVPLRLATAAYGDVLADYYQLDLPRGTAALKRAT